MDLENATTRVEEFTELAMSGQAGLDRVVASLGPLKISSFSRADVMRGIADRVLPNQWEWDVAEFVDGGCALVVKRT
jgi:hypothetical protein